MLRFMVWFVFSVSLPIFSYAQDRAAINGAITDATTALVANATVELKSTNTGLHRVALTNDVGLYEITALPVASYTISIAKTGFKPLIIDQIDLRYGETRTTDAKLEVGGTAESVQVSATAEALDRTNAEVGGVIESAQIKEIPVSGRN